MEEVMKLHNLGRKVDFFIGVCTCAKCLCSVNSRMFNVI